MRLPHNDTPACLHATVGWAVFCRSRLSRYNSRHSKVESVTQKQNLTRVAAGGTAWLMGSGASSMLLSLSAQIALGWILSEDDFGLYALAIAVAACLQVFRDGGVSLWLARQKPDEFDQIANQAFWLCDS